MARWIRILVATLMAAPLLVGSARGGEDAKVPNVVFILADDLGWADLSLRGSTLYESPRIDRLAAEGLEFTNAYVNAPNCAPGRASILTGQFLQRHGILTVGNSDRGQARDRKIHPIRTEIFLYGRDRSLAAPLSAAGYATISIGKWHLGESYMGGPLIHGFDENIAGSLIGGPSRYFSPYYIAELENGPKGEYLTDRLTDEACRFLERNRDRPFFLYVPHYAVHTPIQGKPELIEKYRAKGTARDDKQAEYAAMIQSLDESVGRILDTLDRLDLARNTLVVFFSDNGGHGKITTNHPLRGAKGMLYEGGIRVPLIVRWPGRVAPGTRCEVPVLGSDLYPTLLEATGTPVPEGHPVDGVSLLPLLDGGDSLAREELHWHYPVYLDGKAYDGARDPIFRQRPAAAVRVGNFKLIEYFEDGATELFDLSRDLGETTDVSAKHPDVVEDLLGRMKRWRAANGARVPTERNPRYRPREEPAPKPSGDKKP